MENPMKMDDLGVKTTILGNPQLGFLYIIFELVGALLAALAFCVVRPADVGGIESPGKRREQLCSYLERLRVGELVRVGNRMKCSFNVYK